jgi:DNA-binding beta-propeller fold protein YncE/ABC-type Fe3+ transport system permease subunit
MVFALLACVVGAIVLWPAAALLIEATLGAGGAGVRASSVQLVGSPVEGGGLLAILVRSIAWSLGAACVGALAGWWAARAMPRVTPRALRAVLTLAILLPLALPPWLLYAGLWLSVGPGTTVGDFAERSDIVPLLRNAILLLALVAWSAAPAFAVLTARRAQSSSGDTRLAEVDGLNRWERLRAAWARDWRLLAVSVVTATAFLLGETTAFDLALVPTFGFELRSMDALGASAGSVLATAAPAILLVVVGIALVAWITRSERVRGLRERVAAERTDRFDLGALIAVFLLAATVLVPVSLFARALLDAPRLGDFLVLHGRALISALVVAAVAALVVSMVAVALRAALAMRRSSFLRRAGVASAILCALASLVPGTVVAIALEAGYNHHATAFVYDTPLVVVCTLAARALAVAALVAIALDGREPNSARNLRALDGSSLAARVRGLRAELALAGVAAFPVAIAWSLGELTASGRVIPPGFQWIATDILNAIHYQRPETVLFGAAALLVAAILAIVGVRAVVLAVGRQAPRTAALALVAAAALGMVACDRTDGGSGGGGLVGVDDANAPTLAGREGGAPGEFDAPLIDKPVGFERFLGGAGRGKGQFNGPRVLAVSPVSGDTFVIDKDARVQRFSPTGEVLAEWSMPTAKRGKPVGASVAPDGSLVVADTHEHRLVAFSPTGDMLWTLGEYGMAEGQFIYPTDIAFAPDGRMFVAEYGSNDRIQVFDSNRRFLYRFGAFGIDPGQFLRPQVLVYDAERDELYVADVGNHRIQVFTSDGEFRRMFGVAGKGPGELAYPFGLVVEIDGKAITAATGHPLGEPTGPGRRTVVVAEHGNHRVQRLDATTGESLGMVGGLGTAGGRLKYPWALEPAGLGSDGVQRYAVCDHANSRILFFAFPNGD